MVNASPRIVRFSLAPSYHDSRTQRPCSRIRPRPSDAYSLLRKSDSSWLQIIIPSEGLSEKKIFFFILGTFTLLFALFAVLLLLIIVGRVIDYNTREISGVILTFVACSVVLLLLSLACCRFLYDLFSTTCLKLSNRYFVVTETLQTPNNASNSFVQSEVDIDNEAMTPARLQRGFKGELRYLSRAKIEDATAWNGNRVILLESNRVKYRLGSKLTRQEQEWLIDEINTFVAFARNVS